MSGKNGIFKKGLSDKSYAIAGQHGVLLSEKPSWLKKVSSPLMTITLGKSIYLGEYFVEMPEEAQVALIRHELVHVRQQNMFTLPLFLFLYILILPIGVSIFRWLFELEAYLETARAWHEQGYPEKVESTANHFAKSLAGKEYGWGFPVKWISVKVFMWRAKKFA